MNQNGRERLLDSLSSRINHYSTTNDPAPILDPAALDEAAALLELTGHPAEDVDVCFTVGGLYWCRWGLLSNGRETPDFLRAVDFLIHVHRDQPERVPRMLADMFDKSGHTSEALRAGRLPREWAGEAVDLIGEHGRTGDQGQLDRAIFLLRKVFALTSRTHDEYLLRAKALTLALRNKHGSTGDPGLVDEIVEVSRHVVEAIPDDDADAPIYLHGHVDALLFWFERTHDLAALDEAVSVLGRAARTLTRGQTHFDQHYSMLCTVLAKLLSSGTPPAQVSWVTGLARAAVTAIRPDHSERAWCLTEVGGALIMAYEASGETSALDEALRLLREASTMAVGGGVVGEGVGGGELHASVLHNLTAALLHQAERTGSSADLEECVTVGRAAIAVMPRDHWNRKELLSSVSGSLGRLAVRTRRPALLAESVDLARQALAMSPEQDPDHSVFVFNLGFLLGEKFQFAAENEVLEESVQLLRRAIALTPAAHPQHVQILRALATMLNLKYEHTGEFAALDEAKALARRAASLAADPGTGR